jgi:hypothetical protein
MKIKRRERKSIFLILPITKKRKSFFFNIVFFLDSSFALAATLREREQRKEKFSKKSFFCGKRSLLQR